MAKKFWTDLAKRATVKQADKLLIGNSDTGATEYCDLAQVTGAAVVATMQRTNGNNAQRWVEYTADMAPFNGALLDTNRAFAYAVLANVSVGGDEDEPMFTLNYDGGSSPCLVCRGISGPTVDKQGSVATMSSYLADYYNPQRGHVPVRTLITSYSGATKVRLTIPSGLSSDYNFYGNDYASSTPEELLFIVRYLT